MSIEVLPFVQTETFIETPNYPEVSNSPRVAEFHAFVAQNADVLVESIRLPGVRLPFGVLMNMCAAEVTEGNVDKFFAEAEATLTTATAETEDEENEEDPKEAEDAENEEAKKKDANNETKQENPTDKQVKAETEFKDEPPSHQTGPPDKRSEAISHNDTENSNTAMSLASQPIQKPFSVSRKIERAETPEPSPISTKEVETRSSTIREKSLGNSSSVQEARGVVSQSKSDPKIELSATKLRISEPSEEALRGFETKKVEKAFVQTTPSNEISETAPKSKVDADIEPWVTSVVEADTDDLREFEVSDDSELDAELALEDRDIEVAEALTLDQDLIVYDAAKMMEDENIELINPLSECEDFTLGNDEQNVANENMFLDNEAIEILPIENLVFMSQQDEMSVFRLTETEHDLSSPPAELGVPIKEVEDTIEQIVQQVEVLEPKETEEMQKLLNEVMQLSLEPQNTDTETLFGEEEIQEQLEELFIQLFDKLGIDYTPELLESFVYLALSRKLEDLEAKMEENEETPLKDTGTHEFIKKLLKGVNNIKKAIAHAYLIGKSAMRLYSFEFSSIPIS